MKLLILSRSMGGGHNSAARALEEAVKSLNEASENFLNSNASLECDVVDASVFTKRVLSDASSHIYVNSVRRFPGLFGEVYKIAKVISTPKFKSVVYLANHKGAGRMLDFIERGGYDGIAATNLFPIETMTYLKRTGRLKVPCFGVTTDYTCIPFWEDTEMDLYFTPAADLNGEYVAKKMPENRLIPTGIPVSQRFLHKTEKSEAKRRLNLDENRRYILVMSGSMGAGYLESTVSAALSYGDGITPIVVCGSNAELKAKLEAKFGSSAVIVGFTDKVELYMSASEAVVTKAGGLTSTEAAVFGIPIIHTGSIPGCETKNAEYFSSHGMSISGSDVHELMKNAIDLINDKDRVDSMLAAQKKYINPHAAEDIVREMVKYIGNHRENRK